jgi:hypothetical protein
MVQATANGSITLVLGRTDVYDRRLPGSKFATGDLLCDVAKLPIGNLTLVGLAGDVVEGKMRVSLWEGEVTVNLTTTAGTISARIFAFVGGNAPSGGASGIIVAEINTTMGESVGDGFDVDVQDGHVDVIGGRRSTREAILNKASRDAVPNAIHKSGVAWVFTAADANANAPHPVYSTESYSCRSPKYKSNPPAVIGMLEAGGDVVRTSEQHLLVGAR